MDLKSDIFSYTVRGKMLNLNVFVQANMGVKENLGLSSVVFDCLKFHWPHCKRNKP